MPGSQRDVLPEKESEIAKVVTKPVLHCAWLAVPIEVCLPALRPVIHNLNQIWENGQLPMPIIVQPVREGELRAVKIYDEGFPRC